LSAIVLIPLSAVVFKSAALAGGFLECRDGPRALARFGFVYHIVLGCAFEFAPAARRWGCSLPIPGRRFFDSIVDSVCLADGVWRALRSPHLFENAGLAALVRWGIQSAFSPLGIGIALASSVAVCRAQRPAVLRRSNRKSKKPRDLGRRRDDVRGSFCRISMPALLTAFTMAFARALGEYGSVVFISGNMPMKTEILPLLIITQLEQYQYAHATALGTAMLVLSFGFLLLINQLQRWSLARRGAV
jgi:sulfate transport system permease protein